MAAKKGRISLFNQQLADKICELLAEGNSLTKICAVDGMPSVSTVISWHIQDREGFSAQYTRARQIGYEVIADGIRDKAADDSNDVTGELQMPNSVAVQRSRLIVDTDKWFLGKVLPKIYGDSSTLKVGGDPDGAPIQSEHRIVFVDSKE